MKNLKALPVILLTALFITGAILTGGTAHATNYGNLEIVNHTGYTLREIYFVPVGYNSWERNQLDNFNRGKVLSNGSSFNFSYDRDISNWFLKIVFMNGDSRTWDGDNYLRMNGAWRITVFANGKSSNGFEKFAVAYN